MAIQSLVIILKNKKVGGRTYANDVPLVWRRK